MSPNMEAWKAAVTAEVDRTVAEAAQEIPDAAVEAAAARHREVTSPGTAAAIPWDRIDDGTARGRAYKDGLLRTMRAALEAAQPFMGDQPVVSRERVQAVILADWTQRAEAKIVASPEAHTRALADALLAAGVFREPDPQAERALMAAGIISAAAAQRALADKAATSHGRADYTDNAEWLEEFAAYLMNLS